jgi:ABC-2 type transport system ATP-binding protein
MKVQVHNLRRYFGTTRAVDGISFSFESGQIFGFIGPNGAGKTTTMRILATLDEPTTGDATIDGISIIENPESARRLVGYMPDTLPMHRDITVHEYLDFFARAYDIHRPQRAQVVASVEDFTNLLGIRDKTLRALSKGMKQRVSLARAIIHDPPLLVLDEPAAGLDPRARVELRELLKVLARDQGKAVLISSHILTELAEICDGAVIIEHGRIVAAGTIDDILRGGGQADESEPRIKVTIRAVCPPEQLHKALLEMPHVVEAYVAADHVEAEIAGTEEMTCDLLVELIRREFRILEFAQRRAHLEEIFMNVTRGEVS